MKDEIWQKRQFILSSFARQNITINTEVYRFVDKIIRENWDLEKYDLIEIDKIIRKSYEENLRNGQR
jgi:predicted SnoaL-like aldol condensation-catalyzing enzyme